MPYFELHTQAPKKLTNHQQHILGEQPFFHQNVVIHRSTIGAWAEIGPNSHISETTFGDYSYTAGSTQIIYADVGKFCSIASHVRINPGNHPMWRVTRHHITYRRRQYGLGEDDQSIFDWRRAHRCTIGHDVWIGHGATIMPGVDIGTGAVIGSGAVVTKPVAPYTIAAGVPAAPLRKRFPDDISARLLQIAWWDWDHTTPKARFDDLMNVEEFIEKYG